MAQAGRQARILGFAVAVGRAPGCGSGKEAVPGWLRARGDPGSVVSAVREASLAHQMLGAAGDPEGRRGWLQMAAEALFAIE